MDYIQLEIGGKARGLKFNQKTYKVFYDYIDPSDHIGSFHYAAVYAAITSNCYVKREEFTESFETVCGWVDEMSNEDKMTVTNVFSETAYFKKAVEDGEAETKKKEPKKKNLNQEHTMKTA